MKFLANLRFVMRLILNKLRKSSLPPPEISAEKLQKAAEEKYQQLYLYASGLLKEELDRFTRADEKASKLNGLFVFLMGASAFFDKLIADKLLPPQSPLEWVLMFLGSSTLVLSFIGWFMANRVPRLRGYARLPLTDEVLEFFEKQPLLNFYGGFARNIKEAFELNVAATDRKHRLILKTSIVSIIAAISLVVLVALYGLYCWQHPGKFDSVKDMTAGHSDESKETPPPAAKLNPADGPAEEEPADSPKPDPNVVPPKLFMSLNSQPLGAPARDEDANDSERK